jgi:hypothetical protein
MKTLLITLLIQLTICSFAVGQSGFSRFFDQHKNDQGVENFTISTSIFRFFLDSNEQELKDLLAKLDEISFFIANTSTPSLTNDFEKSLPEKEYKELMIVKNGTSTVRFKAKEKSDRVDEVVMVVTEPNSLVAMCIKCNITFAEAKKLASSINVNQTVSFKK